MVVFNYSGGEINTKIVYYGPGLSGKTTNIEYIYEKMPAQVKGKMISMKTRTDRTLFFDFLPLDLGNINGFKIRFLLYTVPGQVYYNATRKLVLKGADAVVFVADSASDKLRENIESLKNLEANLNEHNLTLDSIPWVIQYNKRDLENALPVPVLEEKLNVLNVPSFEAIATQGVGVYETFQMISGMLYKRVQTKMEEEEEEEDSTEPSAVEQPPPSEAKVEDTDENVTEVVDAALREVPTSVPLEEAPALEDSGIRKFEHDEQPTMYDKSPSGTADERDGKLDAGQVGLKSEVGEKKDPLRGGEENEFQFASIKEMPVDRQVGRLVDLEDDLSVDKPAEQGEFITDPCGRGEPCDQEEKGVPARAPDKKELRESAEVQTSDEMIVKVPVVISPSQVRKNIPLKLVLEIRVLDE